MKSLVLISIIALASCQKASTGHDCPFSKCPFKGQSTFINTDGCEDGSDCNLIDRIHFDYPNESYDFCENRLFN